MRHTNKMLKAYESLSLDGNLVFLPVFLSALTICGDSVKTPAPYVLTDNILSKLKQLHFKKIEASDAIYVVNYNGYIGEGTREEIEYAKTLGKQILYMEEEKG